MTTQQLTALESDIAYLTALLNDALDEAVTALETTVTLVSELVQVSEMTLTDIKAACKRMTSHTDTNKLVKRITQSDLRKRDTWHDAISQIIRSDYLGTTL